MKKFRSAAPVLLYILHSGNLYGTERMALATMEGLDEYAVRVLIAPPPSETGSALEAAKEAGFQTLTFGTRWQLLRGVAAWFLRHRSIDVIGVGVGSSLVCHALGRLLGVRLRQLQVAHGGNEDSWAYASKHRLNAIPIGIVAVSDFVRQKLLQYGVRADSISVIDNFLSDRQRREYGRRPPYAGPGARSPDPARLRVAVVSRVDPIKRVELLVRAAELHGLESFQFDIYGTGLELDRLRQRSAGLPNIRFHGYVSDVKHRLESADLLLHLCPEEPFGLVILEAFLSRLVVVVPDSGGAGSLVDDGRSGFRFKANDPDDLHRLLETVRALDPASLERIAAAGADALDSRFAHQEGIRRYRLAFAAAAASRR